MVFVTGGTGFVGRGLIEELLRRGHKVRALVRPGSEGRLPKGTEPVIGDALDGSTYKEAVAGAQVFVHLVGTPKPAPLKGKEFRRVDLGSAVQAGQVAKGAGVKRFRRGDPLLGLKVAKAEKTVTRLSTVAVHCRVDIKTLKFIYFESLM